MKPIITTHDFRCDLNSGTTEASLRRALMHQDAMADCFRVSVVRDMNPVDLSGMQVTGFLQLASTGQTLPLTGDVSGHYASVTLTSACYAIPGKASLTIQLRKDDTRRSLLKVDFTIRQTGTDAVVDPEDIVPSLSELLAERGFPTPPPVRTSDGALFAAEDTGCYGLWRRPMGEPLSSAALCRNPSLAEPMGGCWDS